MSSYKRKYSSYNSDYNKPKTVGFDDSEAEEDTDIDLDSEPGEGEYFEYLVDKLDCLNTKFDSIIEKQKIIKKLLFKVQE